jgi:hypothetical protein
MQPVQNILGVLLVASAAVSAVGASAVPAAPAAWAAAPLPHCPSGPALSAALGGQIKPSSPGLYHSKFPGGQQSDCSYTDYRAGGKVAGTVGVTLWTFGSASTAKARYEFYWSNAKIAAAHGSAPPRPLPPKRFGTGFATKSSSAGVPEYWLYGLEGRTLAALDVHVPAASLAEAETAMLDVVR